jgi:hypothetical protein
MLVTMALGRRHFDVDLQKQTKTPSVDADYG